MLARIPDGLDIGAGEALSECPSCPQPFVGAVAVDHPEAIAHGGNEPHPGMGVVHER